MTGNSDEGGYSELVFLGPRRRYHSKYSGYEALTRFIGADFSEVKVPEKVERRSRAVASLVAESIRGRLFKSLGQRWYGRQRFLQEIYAAPTLLLGKRTIVHHLYAEESYRFGGWVPKLRGSRLVGTFHMPPSRFRDYVSRPSHLRRLDGVIAVSRSQLELLSSYSKPDRVFFVPLGVDCEFFSPAPEPPRDFRCLFVGYFLRDFTTLRQVIERLAPQGIRFDLVLSPGKARAFRGLDGVSVATGVSDEALRDAYRRASVLVLPLLDSTSNNALVESMACGLPVVSNDVGGTRDYCDSSHSILVPSGDVDGFCKAIVRLAADQGVRRRMSARARRRAAAEFDWKVVAAEVRRVYRQVLG